MRYLVDPYSVKWITYSRVDMRTTREVDDTRCLRKWGKERCMCGKAMDAACKMSSVAGRNVRVSRIKRAFE